MEITCPKCDRYVEISLDWDQAMMNIENEDTIHFELEHECDNDVPIDGCYTNGWEGCGHSITVNAYAKIHTIDVDRD